MTWRNGDSPLLVTMLHSSLSPASINFPFQRKPGLLSCLAGRERGPRVPLLTPGEMELMGRCLPFSIVSVGPIVSCPCPGRGNNHSPHALPRTQTAPKGVGRRHCSLRTEVGSGIYLHCMPSTARSRHPSSASPIGPIALANKWESPLSCRVLPPGFTFPLLMLES